MVFRLLRDEIGSACHKALWMFPRGDPDQDHISVPDQDALLAVPHGMGRVLYDGDLLADGCTCGVDASFVSGVVKGCCSFMAKVRLDRHLPRYVFSVWDKANQLEYLPRIYTRYVAVTVALQVRSVLLYQYLPFVCL